MAIEKAAADFETQLSVKQKSYYGSLKSYFKERPSAGFLLGFMILLALCSILLIFKQEKIARGLANIAYLLLVIGVGVEAYHIGRLNKRKEHDESN